MTLIFLRSLPFLCCLLFFNFFISPATADNTTQNFHYFCNDVNDEGNFTSKSTYETNLNTLLSTLTSNTEIDYGFYNFTYGQNSDKVNAIGLCRGDIKPDDCRVCLNGSRANLTQLCPNRKEVIGWYEDEKCMLRYSNRSIFNLMENGRPAYFSYNEDNATQVEQFNQMLNNLLDDLKGKAASGDSKFKYATGNVSAPNNQQIYGLVQCTPDLSSSDCDNCLVQSIARIPLDFKDKKGGRYVRPSCNMRFETSFIFYGPPAYPPPPPPPGNGNKTTIIIAVTVSVVTVAVAAVLLRLICIRLRVRKRGKKLETQQEEYDDSEIDISESLQFNFNTIRDATNDFSDSNKLGQGGFGAVYRGRLSNGQDIAVKRLSANAGQGDTEFKNEVLLVAKLQHHENKRAELDWEKRYKIIAGTARGILYLHEDSRLRIIHRDLKASNILLDEEMNPKISDFGLARLFIMDQTHGDTNRIVGTYGYMAPEYAMHGQFSIKSDVFSFGVLVLEIVSGQKNSGIRHGENIEDLLSFAWKKWREGTPTEIIDTTLLNNGSQNEIVRCIHIGLLCVQENVAGRPTMASVVLALSSHSLALPVPQEPAFYMDSRIGNLSDMQFGELNSGATRSSQNTTNSAQESANEASITDLFPR
ncbi:hypothetical protein RJT34_25286 [Clitoria ternatea]|uniref:Cysteine-rich receptor-like protein kinase 29 n=1 Tax=Clitoria ternatea TaxID=43366 RepID=A0AAN9IIR5_CLITE